MSGRQGTREEKCVVSESPFGKLISSYTREQALADGVLVDVSAVAHEAGIRYPVSLTRAVWDRYVEVPECVAGFQDRDGRLWDIVWMLRHGILRSKVSQELLFELYVANEPGRPKLITLKAVCGPGDTAKAVITVMLPDED